MRAVPRETELAQRLERAEVRELVLPVAARRGDPGISQPVEGDVVEHVVPRQRFRELSLGWRAHRPEDRRRRLVVAVAVVDQQGGEADRRIGESVECLRTRRHLQRGANVTTAPAAAAVERKLRLRNDEEHR